MSGAAPPGPDQGGNRLEGLRRDQPPGLLVPDLPAPDPGHPPEAGEQARTVSVDGERGAVMPLDACPG